MGFPHAKQPLRLPSASGTCPPPRSDFSIRQRTKNGCSPMLHPFPKQLISFSAGNLRESLRGPQPSQLSFVSRRPACPAVPPFPEDARRGRSPFNFSSYPGDLRTPPSPLPGDARRGRSPFAFLPQAGACTPPRSDFSYPAAHKKRLKPNAPSVPETSADRKSLPLHQNPCAATPCADFDAPSRKRRLPLARFQLI